MEQTDEARFAEICGMLLKMTDISLLNKISKVVRLQKEGIGQQQRWEVGQQVQMLPEHQGRKPFDSIGKIVKVNKVKVKINFQIDGIHQGWNIPKSMLQTVEG